MSVYLLLLAITPLTLSSHPCEIWGEVIAPGHSDRGTMTVALIARSSTPLQVSGVVQGNFEFRSVLQGAYQLKVVDRRGKTLLSEMTVLKGTGDHITLVLPELGRSSRAIQTTSLSMLSHKVDHRARRAFEDSQKANSAGDIPKQLGYLEYAVTTDPYFAEAHNNLAAVYGEMGRDREAVEHAMRAFELNPDVPQIGPNLTFLLLRLKRYAEAETIARHALKNRADDVWLRTLLGVSLIEQGNRVDEALGYVQQAATEFPAARLFIAHALTDTGRLDLAAAQAEEALRSAVHPCAREELQHLIDQAKSTDAGRDPNLDFSNSSPRIPSLQFTLRRSGAWVKSKGVRMPTPADLWAWRARASGSGTGRRGRPNWRPKVLIISERRGILEKGIHAYRHRTA